jgi:hypothetical protein
VPSIFLKPSVKVLATKTWDLVQRYDIYSCPDTPDYEFARGAESLLLHSKGKTEPMLRVVDIETSLAINGLDLRLDEPGLQERLEGYIAEARRVPGILDDDVMYHRFYFLRPDLIQSLVRPGSLETDAVLTLWQEKDFWFRWPKESEILQRGWTRHPDGDRSDCYLYDAELIQRLRRKKLEPDGRNNGPAILAFRMAGGQRPKSGGGGWPIHHIYDGQALIPKTRRKILHAVQDEEHFTHSGGLVALHPAAHLVAHQSELLGWLLRWEAFRRFKYDPDKIFSHT